MVALKSCRLLLLVEEIVIKINEINKMDDIVCPRLSGFVKFTQKLMMRVQKRKGDNDNGNRDLCPICGCKSPKGNLCRACFMRSFAPIAYSRNIKVVEQNEFFYRTGKEKWNRKLNESEPNRYEIDNSNDVMNYVVSTYGATRCSTYDNSLGSLDVIKDDICSGDPRMFNGKTISELFQPAEINQEESPSSVEEDDSQEFVQVELTGEEPEPDLDVLGPLPKLVPDFWEPSEDDSSHKLSDRLKMITNHVVKEAGRPFKEMFGQTKSDSGLPSIKVDNRNDDGSNSLSSSADSIKGFIKAVQKKLQKQTQTEPTQTESTQTCKETNVESHNCASLNKQLKQNATLELLKVAFKTNMILSSLFYYFKKVVETEGSSESPSDNHEDTNHITDFTPTDCRISVDSFFFPNKHSAVLWGNGGGGLETVQSCSMAGDACDNQDSKSDVEVLSRSQATLSMLRSKSWMQFSEKAVEEVDNCNMYKTGYDSEPKYLSRLLTGRVEQQDSVVEVCCGRDLGRGSVSEGNCFKPKMAEKFHMKRSRLVVGEQSDDDSLTSSTENVAKIHDVENGKNLLNTIHRNVYSSLLEVSDEFDPPSKVQSDHSQNSLLDLVFGLNRSAQIEPSLLPLPDYQQDLITLNTPGHSREGLTPSDDPRKDAISQTTLSSKHLEQEMNLLHKAFLDQLAHFSVQLVDSCKTFGHSWQTSFLAELVDHFRSACNIISSIIGDSQTLAVPSSDRLDDLQNVSNRISVCLARLRAHPHSFIGDCGDHDISTLLSSPPAQETQLINTWV